MRKLNAMQPPLVGDTTGDHIFITMGGPQLTLLDRAYSALKESVYDALIVQTRLKPYLDDIGLALDAGGNFSLDFAGMDAANDGVREVAA